MPVRKVPSASFHNLQLTETGADFYTKFHPSWRLNVGSTDTNPFTL